MVKKSKIALEEESEGIAIAEAYDRLPRIAFALWIRLAVLPPRDLEWLGLFKLAAKINYRRRALFDQLQILRNAGFIRYRPPALNAKGKDKVTKMWLIKRPMLVGMDQFIKLS